MIGCGCGWTDASGAAGGARQTLCAQGDWEEAEREALLMPFSNVKVEARHYVPVLRCAGLSGEKFVPVEDLDRKRGEDTCMYALNMLDGINSVRTPPLGVYRDEKVANRDTRVWHFVIEKGP